MNRAAVPGRVPPGLTVQRAWPHPDGLAVEARDPTGAVVALLAGDSGDVHVLGARDPGLPALAAALARPGAVLLGHRPGRRAVLRDADGSYLKVVRARRSHRVADGLRQAADRLRGIPGAPLVPAVLDEDHGAGWVRLAAVPGPSLHELLRSDPRAAVRFSGSVAAALAALRRVPGDGLPRHGADDEIAVLHRWVGDAARWGDPGLTRVLPPVAAALRALPAPRWAACHRDLHDKQLLATGSAPPVGLLDLDTLGVADPALDPANLLAHLHLRVLQGRCDGGTARACAVPLLDPVLDPAALATYTAAALLRLAAVYTFRPGPPGLTARLAAAATDPASVIPRRIP